MGLWFGQPLYLLSSVGLLLVTLGLLMLFLTYEMGFSYLVSLSGESVEVPATISEIKKERLQSGGLAYMATAQVRVNEVVVTAFGFGPSAEMASPGDAVTIVVPKAAPKLAYLKDFWPKPVSPGLLLRFSLWFYIPGIAGLFWSAYRSWRAHNLIQLGFETTGERSKKFGLPRPLKDKQLSRWHFEDSKGKKRSFWTLQPLQLENPTLLSRGTQAALLELLLPNWEMTNGAIDCGHFWRSVFVKLSIAVMVFQLLLVVLFFLT